MLGEGEKDTVDSEEGFTDEDAAATIVMDDDSVEINVDELVAKIESDADDASRSKKAIRKRLDELNDEREAEKELDSTYNFNLDDDL
ncbi:MAG: hypothetical protein QNJ07_15265 [Woeseiaceae bacterium]|nr:hypothetical protein [Woeseiaceae bacterium]